VAGEARNIFPTTYNIFSAKLKNKHVFFDLT
jgi:hypothetical protein